MEFKLNTLIVVGKKVLRAKPIIKHGFEMFSVNVISDSGHEEEVCSAMSEHLVLKQLEKQVALAQIEQNNAPIEVEI